MQWSKLKQLIEARFADSLAGRVEIHTTYYRQGGWDNLGRGWVAVDGLEIANFCDYQAIDTRLRLSREIESGNLIPPVSIERIASIWTQAWEMQNMQGLFERWDFHRALFDSLSLSIEDMLASENGIIRALAMVDRRLGKRRLRTLALADDELPFVR